MVLDFLKRLNINEDVDAEFNYWKDQFLVSVWMATGFALAIGTMIAFWPIDSGNAELRNFVRDFWTLFIECAFWFGFLLGLLWGAAKRIGSGLSATLPWQSIEQLSSRAATARFFGQWASGLALGGIFLWLTQQFGSRADAYVASLFAFLTPLITACLVSSAIFAGFAIIRREPSFKSAPSLRGHKH
ncbi:MAG TPA: hypothetical protein VJ654_05235 [Noviherbaspirillum sp.]|nr:hypothetical protein [Noviherbaspirillum sp.]